MDLNEWPLDWQPWEDLKRTEKKHVLFFFLSSLIAGSGAATTACRKSHFDKVQQQEKQALALSYLRVSVEKAPSMNCSLQEGAFHEHERPSTGSYYQG